jgi:bromodomain-containing factor 1
MSESVQASAKVPRERDDVDSEDEPVAKRTKVEHADGQVQAKPATEGERMEVDGQTASQGGSAKNLSDDALNDSPITEWQNKQIRQVLAGVKKTKVGGLFRLPVQQLWPQLWADYSVKVTNPTDISSMEKRLRGDGPRYANMGEFKQDLELMVQNSIDFNGEGHDVTLQARACRDAILARMAVQSAVEPVKPERKESAKAHSTRHVEHRATAPPVTTTGQARPSKGGASSPAQSIEAAAKPAAVPESPAFALPPGSNGVPLIRRDSTKPESRTKRPVKPAIPKDLVYDTKRKKKLPLELRFCDEVLTELRKSKHYDINSAFMNPVDPVALNIPNYHKVIKKPMDLSTMGNKLSAGEYTSAKEFEKDFDLMIKNCRTFNGEDHIVYNAALKLQDLYRAEMSRKDEWMARHAPASAAAAPFNVPSPHNDDSESEAESEHDADDEERKQTESRVATIQKRLDQEQKKISEMVNSGTADITDVEVAQSVVAMLQKQLMQERAKLANLPAKKPSKPKPAKAKKSGGAAGAAAKKAAVAGGSAGAARKTGGTKKASAKRKIGALEKEIIIESIGELEGPLLTKAIDLIKKDTGQGENAAGELELDIDMVSEEALVKLYDIAIKANPNALAEKQRQQYGAAHTAPPPPDLLATQAGPSKSKKNKPMSKSEQERRIQQLNELRSQALRQGSGSQEPMESIEGNGHEPVGLGEAESEEEVDSEED